MIRAVVLDCSVTSCWFIADEASHRAQQILSDIAGGTTDMLVPSLWWFETMNVLKSAVVRKRIDEQTARKTVLLLKEIPMQVIDPETQGQFGILSLALMEGLSAYDAAYLHLAQSCGAELFSLDKDLLALKVRYRFVKSLAAY
jgi:predicted nucleic acid-binding protein